MRRHLVAIAVVTVGAVVLPLLAKPGTPFIGPKPAMANVATTDSVYTFCAPGQKVSLPTYTGPSPLAMPGMTPFTITIAVYNTLDHEFYTNTVSETGDPGGNTKGLQTWVIQPGHALDNSYAPEGEIYQVLVTGYTNDAHVADVPLAEPQIIGRLGIRCFWP